MLRTQARPLAVAVAAAALLLLPGAASVHAQQDPTAGDPGSTERFSTQELETFVDIESEIQEIGTRYQDRLRNVSDPAEGQALREKMNQEMVEVVNDSSLDVRTYNDIARAAQTDPELAARIEEMR